MNESQQAVMNFNTRNNLQMDSHVRLLDLQSELGELSKEHLEITHYGKTHFSVSPEWKEEMGDIFYSLLSLACETGTDLDDSLARVLEKYEERITRRRTPGSRGRKSG